MNDDSAKQLPIPEVTGTTGIIEFNHWYEDNYYTLVKYCKKYKIPEDVLHDSYLNIHQRISKSGYTTTQYMTYCKSAINNLQINNGKKSNGKYFLELLPENKDSLDFSEEVEEKLREADEMDRDTQRFREEIIEYSRDIFQYITYEKKYDDESLFVFRCYFLLNGRMTYEKLTKMTGINKNHCTKIIQTMKSDIRNNLDNWRNTNDKGRDN